MPRTDTSLGRRLALIASVFAALLSVYTIAFSLRMGYADRECRAQHAEARAKWDFTMTCMKTTGVKNDNQGLHVGSERPRGPH
jgi:hypothetical protein